MFSCSLCFAKVRTLAGLKIHVRRMHSSCGRNKKLVAEVSVLPERAMLEGIHDPLVCHVCGFCCTSKETLTLHKKSNHPPARQRAKDRTREEPAVTGQQAPDLLSFATAVRARAKESFKSDLPHLCCTDDSRKPVAVYVPIFLTEAESDLLVQLSSGRKDITSVGTKRKHSFELQRLSGLMDKPSSATGDSSAPEPKAQQIPHVDLAPEPVDVRTLNEVFEVVRNETQLPDSPMPRYRTFAVSENMLQVIDLASDKAEVFEFAGDFKALMGRELYLHDAGDTVEFHALEPDGSFTTMRAVRKVDAKLRAVPTPNDGDAQRSSADLWTPPLPSLNSWFPQWSFASPNNAFDTQ